MRLAELDNIFIDGGLPENGPPEFTDRGLHEIAEAFIAGGWKSFHSAGKTGFQIARSENSRGYVSVETEDGRFYNFTLSDIPGSDLYTAIGATDALGFAKVFFHLYPLREAPSKMRSRVARARGLARD